MAEIDPMIQPPINGAFFQHDTRVYEAIQAVFLV